MKTIFAAAALAVAASAALAQPGDGIGPDRLEAPVVTEATVASSGSLAGVEHYDFSANFGR